MTGEGKAVFFPLLEAPDFPAKEIQPQAPVFPGPWRGLCGEPQAQVAEPKRRD